jgi:hypothetical protein
MEADMPDWLKRGLRTAGQVLAALPTLVVAGHLLLQELGAVVGFDNQYILWGTSLVGGIAAVSAAWNKVEEKYGHNILPK